MESAAITSPLREIQATAIAYTSTNRTLLIKEYTVDTYFGLKMYHGPHPAPRLDLASSTWSRETLPVERPWTGYAQRRTTPTLAATELSPFQPFGGPGTTAAVDEGRNGVAVYAQS